MPIEWTPLATAAVLTPSALLFVFGGLRFRHWAIDGRSGIPRFSNKVETVLLWLLYSGAVSVGIVVVKQTLRHV